MQVAAPGNMMQRIAAAQDGDYWERAGRVRCTTYHAIVAYVPRVTWVC